MGEGLLGPMVQEEEIGQEMLVVEGEQLIPPQMDLEPEMGAAAAEAAVYDTSPSLPHQNPSPIPAETAQPVMVDMAQLVAVLAGMKEEIKSNTNGMREEMKAMRGEMRQVGQCLQADKRATPRAATNELEGSVPAGEDREIRETCWARREKVTETVTRTLKGEETTSTRETRREVTELTETREITREVEERLHGTDGVEVKDAHTHTEIGERLHGVEEEGDAHTHTHTHTGSEGQ